MLAASSNAASATAAVLVCASSRDRRTRSAFNAMNPGCRDGVLAAGERQQRREVGVDPVVARQLGMKRRSRSRCPGARSRRARPSSASTSTPGPARSIHGARMKTAGKRFGPPRPGSRAALRRLDLAAERVAAHRDVDQIERWLIEAGDVVGRDDHAHARAPQRHPGADARAIGSSRPKRASSRITVVDSPPGMTARRPPASPLRS